MSCDALGFTEFPLSSDNPKASHSISTSGDIRTAAIQKIKKEIYPMETIYSELQSAVTMNPAITNHNQIVSTEEEQAPKLETYPRKHGFGWGSPEKINGCINPKRHVDWVMMTYYGFSLEYLINLIHNLINEGYDRRDAVEAVMAQFGLDEMHADIVSESVFGEPFYALIADIHGWISDYEPDEDDEDDDLARCKREMHEYVVWAVMEELAFLKMDEVNPNP